jgi:ankyrin repeat protein
VKEINNLKDMYKRTISHHAVEHKNYLLAKVLLTVGINPNYKEGCGATPMSLAILNADVNMCKLLLDNFADYSCALFGSFPTNGNGLCNGFNRHF